jgi:hypothetical protein
MIIHTSHQFFIELIIFFFLLKLYYHEDLEFPENIHRYNDLFVITLTFRIRTHFY